MIAAAPDYNSRKIKQKEIQGSYCSPSPVMNKRRGSNNDLLFKTSYQHQMATAQGYMTRAKSKLDIAPTDSASQIGAPAGLKSAEIHSIPQRGYGKKSAREM